MIDSKEEIIFISLNFRVYKINGLFLSLKIIHNVSRACFLRISRKFVIMLIFLNPKNAEIQGDRHKSRR